MPRRACPPPRLRRWPAPRSGRRLPAGPRPGPPPAGEWVEASCLPQPPSPPALQPPPRPPGRRPRASPPGDTGGPAGCEAPRLERRPRRVRPRRVRPRRRSRSGSAVRRGTGPSPGPGRASERRRLGPAASMGPARPMRKAARRPLDAPGRALAAASCHGRPVDRDASRQVLAFASTHTASESRERNYVHPADPGPHHYCACDAPAR
jgi:hypothetical protein